MCRQRDCSLVPYKVSNDIFPPNIVNANFAFSECNMFSGTIDSVPSGLVSAKYAFDGTEVECSKN